MSTNIQTTVSTETIDLSELFPQEESPKTNMFSKDDSTVELSSTEEPLETKSDGEGSEELKKEPIKPTKTVEDVQDEPVVIETGDDQKEFEQAKGGKKADLVEFFKSKIEEGELVPFSDFDETKTNLDDYLKKFSRKEFDELWKANLDHKVNSIAEKLPEQFKDSLPKELQYAAEYAQSGGTDFKGLFKALSQVEEIKSLDPEKHPREVARQYLTATNFGDSDEINEQLDEWEDLGVITKKAEGFKPRLEKMEEQLVQQKIEQQNYIKEKQKEQFDFYVNSVVDAIKDEELHGIKIDKKTQSSLYSGLTQYDFVDSRGNKCNEFTYLLDQKMWVEPDYQTIAMVQWLLKDREGFINTVSSGKVNDEVKNIVKTLKTEQSSIKNNSFESKGSEKKYIPRPNSLFKR